MKKTILGLLLVIGAFSFAGRKYVTNTQKLSADQAKEIAKKHSKINGNVLSESTKLDVENGRYVYEVKIYGENQKFEYEIDAENGNVVSFSEETREGYNRGSEIVTRNEKITSEQAKKIALSKVPGATEQNITKFYLDSDDGILEYEVDIRLNNKKYEIEINGHTGEITTLEEKTY